MICPIRSDRTGDKRCEGERCMWYVTLESTDIRGGKSTTKACAVAFQAAHQGGGMHWGVPSAESQA